MEKDQDKILSDVTTTEYKYGFYSDIEMDRIPKGLSEDVVRIISARKNEPEWLLEFRLKSYRHWLTMKMPTWPNLKIAPINYQDIIFYAAPKERKSNGSIDDIDPELRKTFDKLGIPLQEQKHLAGVAVDAVIDSVSIKTTFKETLAEMGIIFCSFSDAVKEYPDLVKRYMGSVVPYTDNFFATLNSAVFSDGSFCFLFFYIFVSLFRLNTINGIVIVVDYLFRIEPSFIFPQGGKGKPLLPPWGKAGKGV